LFGHTQPSCGAPNVASGSAIEADLNDPNKQANHLRRPVGGWFDFAVKLLFVTVPSGTIGG
jgi:hypothetical protein